MQKLINGKSSRINYFGAKNINIAYLARDIILMVAIE